jgi:virginiamycin A acetyltransferase
MNTNGLVSEDAIIKNSDIAKDSKIYRSAEVSGSIVGSKSIVGDQSILIGSNIGVCVSINRRNYVLHSEVGRYSYTGIGTSIRSAKIGNFNSISWNVSIGGANHDYCHVTTSPLWRFDMMNNCIENHDKNHELQERFKELPDCVIGNDVWIATNVVILRGVTIGNGSVIGAGAIVTKDVEPYSVVVGMPAKVINKRFDENIIKEIEEIQWWNWPVDVIRENIDLIYKTKVDMGLIEKLRYIGEKI